MENDKKPASDVVTTWSAASQSYWQDWDRLKMTNGVLRRLWYDSTGKDVTAHLILPRCLLSEAISAAHDGRLAGHFAVRRTTTRLRQLFYWYNMNTYIRDWCRSCQVCGGRKPAPTRPHHHLQKDPVAEPLQRIAVDVKGPLEPAAPRGNKYILVVVDYLTTWSEAYAMPNQQAETVARLIVEEFLLRFGIAEQLHADQGSNWESKLYTQMCELLGVTKTRIIPYHPSCDGQSEQQIKTLTDILSKLSRDKPTDWDLHLPYAMSAYRSSIHATTKETPNRLMLGREVVTPVKLLVPASPDVTEKVSWVDSLHQRFRETSRLVMEQSKAALRLQKANYDKKTKLYNFNVNDKVWVYDPTQRRGTISTLNAHLWKVPYIGMKKISAAVYLVRLPNAIKGRFINVDRLSPFIERTATQFPQLSDQQDNNEPPQQNDVTTTSEQLLMTAPIVHIQRDQPSETLPTSTTLVNESDSMNDKTACTNFQPVHVTQRAQRQAPMPARYRDYDFTS
jgi:hypothetical protein